MTTFQAIPPVNLFAVPPTATITGDGQYLAYGRGDATVVVAQNPYPQPTGACCLTNGTCTEVTEADCPGTWLGMYVNCDPNPCPQPTGACCWADGTCTVTSERDCLGAWLGVDTTCDPYPCSLSVGACCAADGACAVSTQENCGGIWLGMSTACDPNPCPPPQACCLSPTNCTMTAPWACANQGGTPWPGYTCDPVNPCLLQIGACCVHSGCYADQTEAQCLGLGGVYQGAATTCTPNPCPAYLADLNCDGFVDFDDINPFVTALVGRTGYEAQYPLCRWLNGDIDGNGAVDFDDINPFVACLVAGRCP
jgi:hypothetical protein